MAPEPVFRFPRSREKWTKTFFALIAKSMGNTRSSMYKKIIIPACRIYSANRAHNSISHAVSKLLKALETLSTTADGGIEQVNTVREAENMTDMFRDMSEQIQELRRQADRQITDIVSEIDALAKTVADLNDEIVANGATGRETTDLEDQRDQAINELSNYIDIATFQRSDGDIVIMTRAGRTLVDSVPATLTHAAASKVAATSTHEEAIPTASISARKSRATTLRMN